MRLLSSEMPVGAPVASRSTSNTEKGRRSSGSWPCRLHHDELTGRARRPRSPAPPARARCSRSTAACSRSPPRTRRRASRQYTAAAVRYLRMLSNSIVASALATCYVLILVLQLNPTLPLHPVRLVPLALAIGPFYVVASHRDCLRAARRSVSLLSARAFFAGVDERADARVAVARSRRRPVRR